MPDAYSFSEAFDRNIGWLSEWEQLALRGKRVAIAGMGGVGGFHLLTLARLGIGAFSIADLDRFEVANFNRQVGASLASLGRPKVDVLAEMALAINPDLRLRRFSQGVQPDNIDAFLAGADLFIDGFDFFVLDIRRQVFRRCADLAIPVLTAAPVGMGVGLVGFTSEGMDFEKYFRFEGQGELRQYVHFLLGMAPSGIHRAYLVDPGRLDFARRKAPSTIAGVQLAASATAAAAMKLLLRRGDFRPAPYHSHYDAFLGKLVETRLRWGNAGPLQTLKARAAEKMFLALLKQKAKPERRFPVSRMEQIIDLARWTPSGDNAQPWRFVLAGEDELQVYIRDPGADNVYEYRDGEPTLLSGGMLLESLRIAASIHGRRSQWRCVSRVGGWRRIDVAFAHDPLLQPDRLAGDIPLRSVDRRAYRSRLLMPAEKRALESALEPDMEITWFETFRQKRNAASLNAAATDIRLRIPETFETHRQIIAWESRRSPDRIPAAALGLDRLTLGIMRWAMADQQRLQRLNGILGTGAAQLQMDILPGISCAAHFSLQAKLPDAEPDRTVQLLKLGQAIQRFWLTATHLGLAMQPSLAPLAFLDRLRSAKANSAGRRVAAAEQRLAARAVTLLPQGGADTVFLGRIGEPRSLPASRSVRLPFEDLILETPPLCPDFAKTIN